MSRMRQPVAFVSENGALYFSGLSNDVNSGLPIAGAGPSCCVITVAADGAIAFYVNGASYSGTLPNGPLNIRLDGRLQIGAGKGSGVICNPGTTLSNVAIWSGLLDAADATAISKGASPDDYGTGLVRYWPLASQDDLTAAAGGGLTLNGPATDLPGVGQGAATLYETSRWTQYQQAYSNATPPTPASTASLAGAETTTYSYTFYPDNGPTGSAIETETTSLPAVSTADGGTGSAPTSSDVYNSLGQLVWSQDANGSISYTGYDPATGAVTEQIQDVNFGPTYNVGNTQFDNDLGLLPQSWGLPTTGKNLVTTYHVDSQGRTIEETDPDGDVTCTVYNDAVQTVTGTTTVILNEVRTYPGWNPVTDTTADAIQVSDTVDTDSGSYGETLSYAWSGALPATGSMPTGVEDFSTSSAALHSLSRSLTNNLGQVYEQDDYSDLTGIPYSATSVYLPHADYDSTTNQYDVVGNLTGTVDPDGDITHTVYDFLGNVTSTWTEEDKR